MRSMLNPTQADILDRDRTWKVESTPAQPIGRCARPACFGVSQRRASQRRNKRLCACSTAAANAPKVLHEQATTYPTTGIFQVVAAKTLGGCAVTGSYIQSGHVSVGLATRPLAWWS